MRKMVTMIVMVVIVMMDNDDHDHDHDHDHDDDDDPNPTPTPAPASPFHCPAAVCKVQNETANGQRGCPCTSDVRDFRTNLSQNCGADTYIYMYTSVYIYILIWDPMYHFTSTERGQHSGGGKVCNHKFWCLESLEKLFEFICTICLRNHVLLCFYHRSSKSTTVPDM